MLHQIRRIDAPEVLYAEGGAKVVWVDQRVEKSMPLPQQVREALTGTGA
jgi:acyl-CoA thioester hydrolase